MKYLVHKICIRFIYDFDTSQILTKSFSKRMRRHRKAIYSILCKNLDFPFDMPFASCFCLKWHKIYFLFCFAHQCACACAVSSLILAALAAVLVYIVVLYAYACDSTMHSDVIAFSISN